MSKKRKSKYTNEDERKEAHKASARNYGYRNPRTLENSRLKYAYGITIDEKEEMFAYQLGLCAICAKPQTLSICVDHCHDTGIIRGLLCKWCNTAIGQLDTVNKLQAAINYLESFEAML